MFSSSFNPLLAKLEAAPTASKSSTALQIAGVRARALVLVAISLLATPLFWNVVQKTGLRWPALLGLFGIVASAWVLRRKPDGAAVLAPLFAVFLGLTLGSLAGLAEARFPGIALRVAMAGLGTYFGLLCSYHTRLARLTDAYVAFAANLIAIVATVAFCDLALGYAFSDHQPLGRGYGGIAVLLYVLILVVSAAGFVLDFNAVEDLVEEQKSRRLEWYAAFALEFGALWIFVASPVAFVQERLIFRQQKKT